MDINEKTLEKWNNELIELHKRCIVTYLTQMGLRGTKQRKFFLIYDIYISHKNIRNFFHRPIKMFVRALILDTLDDISYYPLLNHLNHPKKKRKKPKEDKEDVPRKSKKLRLRRRKTKD